MTTLTARLDVAVDDGDLQARLSAQVDLLAVARGLLARLDDDPPGEVVDLLRATGRVRLPVLSDVSGLGEVFERVTGAVPTDLDDLTGSLTATVEALAADVGGELVVAVRSALDAVLAVQRLLELDLTCAPDGGAGGGNVDGGGTGGGGGGGGGGGEATGGGDGTDTGPQTAARTAEVTALVDVVLDTLPDPLDVEGLLTWIAERVAFRERDLLPAGFPMLDDLREPVQRVLAWDAMSAAEIRDELAGTLHAVAELVSGNVGGVVTRLVDDTAAAPTLLDSADLGGVADGLVARLGEARAAVEAGDTAALAATVAALDGLLDARSAAAATLAPLLDAAASSTQRLGAVPDDLAGQLGTVDAALVGSTGIRGAFTTLADAVERDVTTETVTAVVTQISGLVGWLEDLVAALDLSAVADPVTDASDRVTAALADLDAALLAVALDIRGTLEEATALLATVDVAALRQRVIDTIDDLAAGLGQQLGDLAAPARDAVGTVVDQLAGAVDDLDPADIVAALQDVVDAVAGVLSDPEVLATVASVREAIETAVEELGTASITPVTDAVIAAIDEVAELLRGLDTSALPGPAKLALQAALAALPRSIRPLSDPLVDELDAVLGAGPLPLFDRLRQGPADVAARIRALDPGALVGPTLSAPFQELVGRADAVSPSSLLAPVAGAVDELRGRLASELDPRVALAPLTAPHAAILAALDQLDPARLVAPVEAALASATVTVRAAVEDAALAPVGAVVAAVTDTIETIRTIRTTLDRVRLVLADLAALPDDLVAWVDGVFAKLETVGDDGSLATATGALTAAIDDVRADALLDRLSTGLAPLRTRLDDLAPRARLAAITTARRAISPTAVATVTDDALRAELAEVLSRCDPLTVAFARPFHLLAGLHDAVGTVTSDLPAALASWDATHHGPDGLLAGYRDLPPDPGELGRRTRAAFDERFLEPAVAVLRLGSPVAGILAGLSGELGALLAAADDRLADLTAGPAAFEAIRDQLLALIDRVAAADLAVLTDALTTAVDTLRTQVTALDPATFAEELADAVDVALGSVTTDLVLPPADLAALDASYRQVLDALRTLDPERLVTDVVGPAYEAAVEPFVDALDLTPTIDAVTARLAELPDELRSELDRVDTAYQALLRAAPSIDLTDLGLDLSLEVSVPSPF